MKVYLDNDFIAHFDNIEGYIEAEDSFFDYICPENFNCYRFIPDGQSWIRKDGKVFYGKAICLISPSNEATRRQRDYENQLLSNMQTALETLEESQMALNILVGE